MTDIDYIDKLTKSAVKLESDGHIEAAIEIFNKLLESHPNREEIWNNKGVALYNFKKYEEAITAYDRALLINPMLAQTWRNKGTSLIKLGRYEEAIVTCDRAITINPNYAQVWIEKGTSLRGLRRYEEAITAYDRALLIDPNLVQALNLKGLSYAQLEKYDDAQIAYDQSLKLDPNQIEIWLAKGLSFGFAQKFKEAISAFDRVLTLAPNYEFAQNARKTALEQMQKSLNNKPPTNSISPIPNVVFTPNNHSHKSTVLCNDENDDSEPKGFAAVAGMQELKDILIRDVIQPLRNPEKYKKFKVSIPNGILLYGPPGCGKTFIVRKLAEELGYHFIDVPPSLIGSKYIHETSSNIAQIFAEAVENKPAIIFFDEFEGLVPKRESLGEQGKLRNEEINEFLIHLNNAGGNTILVVGATNKINLIDHAVLRSGRMDKVIFVPPPDFEARKALFKSKLIGRPHSETIKFDLLSEKTEFYSSSDITLVVENAARKAVEKNIAEIDEKLLEQMITSTPPSIEKSQIEEYRLQGNFERK